MDNKESGELAHHADQLEIEDIDGKVYTWNSFEEFQISTSDQDRERKISEIFEINRISRYFKKQFLVKGDLQSDDALTFRHIKKHIGLFRLGKFSWEVVFEDMDAVLTTCKTTFSKFSSTMDAEMLDHQLFQKLFPLQLIDQYLSIVNRQYGKPVYDKALRFQTNLLETFLWHHLDADTCFNPKIATEDINLIDPYLRIKIRERNRTDVALQSKYFNKDFDTKQFTYKILDLYFPNVTWRYIGASQEMHRWSLLLMLRLFELGLFRADEIHDLLNLLLQKLENLLVLERRSYQDFTTTLVQYPRFIETLKAYFYECKEIVAAICIQIIVLLNDQDFENNKPATHSLSGSPADTNWKNAYFTDSSISNYINRIMATYLLQFNNTVENSQRASLFMQLNELIKLSTANKEDVYTQSATTLDSTRLAFYNQDFSNEDNAYARNLKQLAIALLRKISSDHDRFKQEELEEYVIKQLKDFLVKLAQKRAEDKNDNLLHLLGFECVPNIVLALHNAILELKLNKEVESIIGLTLIVLCKDSKLNQTCVLNRAAMKHWDLMFNSNPMIAVVLQASIFGDDYRIYFSHHTAMRRVLDHYERALERVIKLGEVDKKPFAEWIKKLEVDVLTSETASNEIDNLVIYYSYCRFLCNMISQKNQGYETRFYNFEIQRILMNDFFTYFLPIIKDENYLPHSSNKYHFTPLLEVSSTPELAKIVHKCSEKSLTVEELKGAVFEVAMLTMKLLNKACTGLFLYSMFRLQVKLSIENLLPNTEYLFDLGDAGHLYRGYVLEYCANFQIFPNNGVISFRNGEFQEEGQGNRETRVILTHRNGKVAEGILKELELIPLMFKLLQESQIDAVNNRVRTYYFVGLLPYLYKFFNGLYTTYIHTTDAETLMNSLMQIHEIFKSTPIILDGRKAESNQDLTSDIETPDERLPDIEEKLYPNVKIIRDTLCILLKRVINIYQLNSNDPIAASTFNFLMKKYQRPSPINSSPSNLEPWKDKEEKSITEGEDVEEVNFKKIFEEYRKQKLDALDKPPESNILITFLQSEASYIPNMITFLDRIIERSFSKLHTETSENTKEAFENMDLLVTAFLENDILFTVVKFFSQVLRSCQSVREGFSSSMETSSKVAGFTLTIIYLQMSLLSQLACTKTFKDSEFNLVQKRANVLSDFLKHLCVENCQKNKKMLGEFAPSVPGLPYVNKSKKPLFYEIYVRTETQLGGFNVWSNTANHLLVSDRPEYLQYLMSFLQIITECCSGPCNSNQKQIYIYRSDMYIGMIRRVIDMVDSSFYPIKLTIIYYIASLIEGDDKLIVNHFASNLTFDELFRLICSTVKRLFIHFLSKKDKKFHQKLIDKVLRARNVQKQQLLLEENQLRGTREKDLEFYLDAIKETSGGEEDPGLSIGTAKSTIKYKAEIFQDSSVVTEEMMTHFQVDNYEDLLNLYHTDPEFSSHVLLVIALKLNEFLNKFIKYVPGYRFSLEKIYNKMRLVYKNATPNYIAERLTTKSPHVSSEFDENIELYMFICKINDEVKIKAPKVKESYSILFPIIPRYYKEILEEKKSQEATKEDDFIEIQDLSKDIRNQQKEFDLYHNFAVFMKAQNPRDRNLFEEYVVRHYDSKKQAWVINLREEQELKEEESANLTFETQEFHKLAKEKIESLLSKITKLEEKVTELSTKIEPLRKE